jgi:hypothetical protein
MPSEDKAVLLTSAYLPNIQYVSKLLTYRDVYIEVNDTYQKQSYRNRTTILGANGPHDLVIPVKRPKGNSTLTKDILLDYTMPWQKTHWRAIISAYKHSPFFDIFEPEMLLFFSKQSKYLLDWNFNSLERLLKISGTFVDLKKTETFSKHSIADDFRDSIHPKKSKKIPDPDFDPVSYFQVFSKKFGFISNLSFIDLLFNEGSQAIYLCKKCMKKEQPNTAAPC